MGDAPKLPEDWVSERLNDGRIRLWRKPRPLVRWLMALIVAGGASASLLIGWNQQGLPQSRRIGMLAAGIALLIAALWAAVAQEEFFFGQGAVEREWRFLGLLFTRRLTGVTSVTSGQRLRQGRSLWKLHLKGTEGSSMFLESEMSATRNIDALAHWLKATCGVQNVLAPFKLG